MGAGRPLRQQRPPGFFICLCLGRCGRPGVLRARRLDRPAHRAQRFPAALGRHLHQAQLARYPGRDLAAGPHAAVVGRRAQPLAQGGQHRFGQDQRPGAIAAALVAERRWTLGIVAGAQLLDPARAEQGDRRHLRHTVTTGQQPDRLHVTAAPGVPASNILRFKLRIAQVSRNRRHPILSESGKANPNRAQSSQESSSGVSQSGLFRTLRGS